jgi:hypothetical protein
MAQTPADLENTFNSDVAWFNADNFPQSTDPAYNRFDDNVAMKRIDDPKLYHTGKSNVATYFSGKGNADKAYFYPRNPPHRPVFVVAGSLGFVSGLADFNYRTVANTDGPTTNPRLIAYSFTYTYDEDEDKWKAIHLWGEFI